MILSDNFGIMTQSCLILPMHRHCVNPCSLLSLHCLSVFTQWYIILWCKIYTSKHGYLWLFEYTVTSRQHGKKKKKLLHEYLYEKYCKNLSISNLLLLSLDWPYFIVLNICLVIFSWKLKSSMYMYCLIFGLFNFTWTHTLLNCCYVNLHCYLPIYISHW